MARAEPRRPFARHGPAPAMAGGRPSPLVEGGRSGRRIRRRLLLGQHIFTMGDLDKGCCILCSIGPTAKPSGRPRSGQPAAAAVSQGLAARPQPMENLVFAPGSMAIWSALTRPTARSEWHKNMQKDFAGQMMSGWQPLRTTTAGWRRPSDLYARRGQGDAAGLGQAERRRALAA